MSPNDKKILNFPIKEKAETPNAGTEKTISPNNNDNLRKRLTLVTIIAMFLSLALTLILALTSTNNVSPVIKKEKEYKEERVTNKETKTLVDNTTKEDGPTQEPKKGKVCVPNSPFPTEKDNIKYTCY